MDLLSNHQDVLLQMAYFETTLVDVWGRFLLILEFALLLELN
ncbi:unnamed protein product [Linum tenue]|uniref:Uncharacterized protein n=1 Tax=Linum tenue TaxID=586396 RepID=A0AAV0QRI8_9ROSI|nr:unnamed protein product [Linum tenue]